MRDFRFRHVIADNDVRARVVGGVKPPIGRARYMKRQVVIVTRSPPDKDFIAVGSAIAPGPRNGFFTAIL